MRFDFPRTAYAEKTATRMAYGKALAALGAVNGSVVAIDGDVKNSTYADKFFEAFPARSFQSYIAEQNMIGMGMGFAAKGFIPFMATFAAFWTRAHDQIRMAAYSESNIKVCGSHVGVSIGEDGASQMGLEDIALFRSVPDCVVLYPGDAVSAEACVEAAARRKGMVYIRASRPATAVLYGPAETFPIGGSKTLRRSEKDAALVVAAGITLHEALKAADALAGQGIAIRVLDAYSVQPLDVDGLRLAAEETGGRVVVVEDHYPAGGLGEAVAAASGRAGDDPASLCARAAPFRKARGAHRPQRHRRPLDRRGGQRASGLTADYLTTSRARPQSQLWRPDSVTALMATSIAAPFLSTAPLICKDGTSPAVRRVNAPGAEVSSTT